MDILISVLIFTSVGVVATAVLVIAAKYMSVPVDEAFQAVREALPGVNCGACGFAGCDAYAQGMVDGAQINLCIPGGESCAKELAEILDRPFEGVETKYSHVFCNGSCENCTDKMEYEGMQSCAACNNLYGGESQCYTSCLGYGDCAAACPYGAIDIIDGIALINREKCTGCGLCVRACPNNIIAILPGASRVFVTCSNHERGAITRKNCSVGCIGCKLCEKKCRFDAIHVVDNLAVIDYDKCTACGECVGVCPQNTIQMYTGTPGVPKAKTAQ